MSKWCGADVSAEYLAGLVQVLDKYGIALREVTGGIGVDLDYFDADLRLTTQQDAVLLENAARLTGNRGIGFELGLSSTMTWHGILGLALMSSATLREALELWERYLSLCTTSFGIHLHEQRRVVELQIHDLSVGGLMRRSALERIATITARLGEQLTQQSLPDVELWFPESEPEYFSAYQKRLMDVRFDTKLCLVRIPIQYLDLRLPSANAASLRRSRHQCERDRHRYGFNASLLARTRLILARGDGSYLSQDEVASLLCMSSSALKRRLRIHGIQFRNLVDEARKWEVMEDVVNTTMTVDEIAGRRGYADAANLTRAFRRWTGESPSRYRARICHGRLCETGS
ncbi:AraC family transcriptional regulator [Dyella sp. A6]|uniref:AraC family transcriptional regulator n=1 Tax=Dyella aluminiiresistens TaxID=3069105 RepID=UPI002E78B3AF|nr:AraC family transcriptional regulator ligand-binding domain-containing protein [Dyella sp. A6]